MQTSKRKLTYYKNLEEPQKQSNKKQIQINTNLEPSQSKKQYQMALAQAKYFKEQNKQDKKPGNQTSISCGGITLNFSQNTSNKSYLELNFSQKDDEVIKDNVSKTVKYSQLKNKNHKLNSVSTQKNHQTAESQQSSLLSPQSFYTPNSFYKPDRKEEKKSSISTKQAGKTQHDGDALSKSSIKIP